MTNGNKCSFSISLPKVSRFVSWRTLRLGETTETKLSCCLLVGIKDQCSETNSNIASVYAEACSVCGPSQVNNQHPPLALADFFFFSPHQQADIRAAESDCEVVSSAVRLLLHQLLDN